MLDRLLTDPVSSITVRRFGLVLGFIVLLSVFGARDHLDVFTSLAAFDAFSDAMLAGALREPLLGPKLAR